MRTAASVSALLLLSLAAAAPARAAQSYDSCTGFIPTLPAVISTQGTWCLDKDLSTAIASGAAIDVTVNNVTIDCTGHKLGGLAAGMMTETVGVQGLNRFNVSVTGCNIRGFKTGVYLTGVGHGVEHNRIEGSTLQAITMASSPGRIRDNFIFDTGPGPFKQTNTAVFAMGNVDIIDNTIEGVAGFVSMGHVVGISNDGAVGNRIIGNVVRDVTNDGVSGTTAGILIGGGGWYTAVRDNVLASYAGSATAAFGIVCKNSHVHTRDNQVFGFAATVDGCSERDNDLEN